jgi:hypothetical protein
MPGLGFESRIELDFARYFEAKFRSQEGHFTSQIRILKVK